MLFCDAFNSVRKGRWSRTPRSVWREGQSAETKEEKGEGRRVVEECKEGRMVEKQ